MAWMKKTKKGAHQLMHHGKEIPIGMMLDVEHNLVGKYKDAGFELVKDQKDVDLYFAAEANKKDDAKKRAAAKPAAQKKAKKDKE